MRIVDRATFLALPAGTLYAKFTPYSFDELEIKGDTIGNDFVTMDLIPWWKDNDSSEDWISTCDLMLAGGEAGPLDYDCGGRDGLFDLDQKFAVFNADDTRALIACLQDALTQAESKP